jgi:hypothetical protein
MFSSSAAPAYSVTNDPFHFLDDADATTPQGLLAPVGQGESPFWEAMGQKRADKSASNAAVRKLLSAAAAGGMSQKGFEMSAVFLRLGRKKDLDSIISRSEGFKGTLWHFYMSSEARMSLKTFNQYLQYFLSKGWLTDEGLNPPLEYSAKKIEALAAVKKMFPPGVPPDWEIERTTRTYRTKRI